MTRDDTLMMSLNIKTATICQRDPKTSADKCKTQEDIRKDRPVSQVILSHIRDRKESKASLFASSRGEMMKELMAFENCINASFDNSFICKSLNLQPQSRHNTR